MVMAVDRRIVLAGGSAMFAWPVWGRLASSHDSIARGWAALDLRTGRRMGAGAAIRLPMCSTFKWLLAACVLDRVDTKLERLERRMNVRRADLLDYAPETRAMVNAAGGNSARVTIGALCKAAVRISDNTAANLLLGSIGGPAGLTRWLRTIGDTVTRLDRREPWLNDVAANDPRDTTTADAMLADLRRILFGSVLTRSSREQLLAWMLSSRTGADRLSAGMPDGWRIAHKTGTRSVNTAAPISQRSAAGDVGVLIPPDGGAILIAAYIAGSRQPQPDIDRWFAELARDVVGKFAV